MPGLSRCSFQSLWPLWELPQLVDPMHLAWTVLPCRSKGALVAAAATALGAVAWQEVLKARRRRGSVSAKPAIVLPSSYHESSLETVLSICSRDVAQCLSIVDAWRARGAGRMMHILVDARCASDRALSKSPGPTAAELFAMLNVRGMDITMPIVVSIFEAVMLRPEFLDARDSASRSLLMKSAQMGSPILVEALLAAKADPNARGGNRWSSLHFAAVGGNTQVCELLLRHGADTQARSADGYVPQAYAKQASQEAVVKMLIGHGSTRAIGPVDLPKG